jgi:ABC-type transport system involved in cytochrome c biogenesis permease subunit
MPIEGITVLCFAASYGVALLLELGQLRRRRPVLRSLGTAFGCAGLLAHTLFLLVHRPLLASQFGSLLFVAWILAVFYLLGSLHHRRQAWSIFVLPIVLGLVVLAGMLDPALHRPGARLSLFTLDGADLWRGTHVVLFTLAAVGISVAFVASLMYLVQAARLRAKVLPGEGLRLLSLERLEAMNRRAITLAFPFLTAGLLVGLVQMSEEAGRLRGWTDPRVLSTVALWLVFCVVLYLRSGVHAGGRRVALWTIVAFGLLVVTLATSHAPVGGAP